MLLLDDEDQVPESPTTEETKLAASLGPAGLRMVDTAILKAAGPRWFKLARVVHDAIRSNGFSTGDVQVPLHVRRTLDLVSAGTLEAQGNLYRPRFSEVRLAAGRQ